VAATLVVGTAIFSAGPVDAATPSTGRNTSVSVSASAVVDFADLADISCPSARSCFAFGYTNVGQSTKTLIEHWDGTSWSVMASPNSASPATFLFGGTCASTTRCLAVGEAMGSSTKTFVLSWDGSVWTAVPTPALPGTSFSNLHSVSCTSAANCFAVGTLGLNGSTRGLVERWNGTTWSFVKSPNAAGATNSGFYGVTCADAKHCYAVGVANGNVPKAIIETWNGTRWAISATPNTNGSTFPTLSSVTCSNASHCFAVGRTEGANEQTLVLRLTGSKWRVLASPPTTGDSGRVFSDVVCTHLTNCFAVGFSDEFISTTSRTLIERWDGVHWTISNVPNVGTTSNVLQGVACASATTCFAVGYGPNAGPSSLIERWNGTRWALSPHPQPTP
jgi:hypothetical protein